MEFKFIAKLLGATASAISKRKQETAAQPTAVRPIAEADEWADQTLPQPRHAHDPLYKRHDDALRATRLPRNSFQGNERQSKSRWVMGYYNAASSPTVTTRATMPEMNDEFCQYVSSNLKKNILDRYAETTGEHLIITEELAGNPFAKAETETVIPIAEDDLYRRIMEREAPVGMNVALADLEEEQTTTVPDSDSNIIFLPDTNDLSGFAKLVARRKRTADKKEQAITADYSEYPEIQECTLPWGDVQVAEVLEDLQPVPLTPCELPAAASSLFDAHEQRMTVTQPMTNVLSEIAEVQRMQREFDELDYIQYILSPKAEVKVLERIAEQDSTPAVVLAQLAFHRHQSIRCAVAENANTPMAAQWFLVLDHEATVRYALAENCHVPLPVLNVLSVDENGYVSGRAHKTINRVRPAKVIAGSFGKSSPTRNVVAS
ncbi:MAG TPA: hypothetical protein V6C81_28135 [Planktothrix sp.]|jgi:hypothetical protein